MSYDQLPSKETIDRTIAALINKGYNALYAENGEDAKSKALEILPAGVEVMNMTSMTLLALGLVDEVLQSGRYQPIRKMWEGMDKSQVKEVHRLEAVQDWAIGSVHALTEDGRLMIASRTGSQMAAYVYGALNVLWVIGAQKIVKDIDDGFKRIYEYVLPLEDARAREAYGTGSSVNKLLIINDEVARGRINLIIVDEALGF
jgi:LUD domain